MGHTVEDVNTDFFVPFLYFDVPLKIQLQEISP